MDKAKIILLFANPYRIVDEKTGEVTEGITINYYFGSDLVPKKDNKGSVGMRPAKCSIPVDVAGKLKTAPALYDAQFEMGIGSDGKPVLKVIDLDFISNVSVQAVKA